MGQIAPPDPVLALLAVTSQYDDAFPWAGNKLAELLSPVELTSERFAFVQTDYYAASMGAHLKKQFLVARQPIDPVRLADWKITTNAWETEFQQQRAWPVERAINLDPATSASIN